MGKKLFYPSIVILLVAVTGCPSNITRLNTAGPYTYKINVVGASKKIQPEAIDTATNLCRSMNKEYRFIRNIILPTSVIGLDMISYTLIFSCVEPGSTPVTPSPAVPETPPEKLGVPAPAPEAEPAPANIKVITPKEQKMAVTKTARSKDKTGATGNTPGEPESLGGPPPSKELGNEKEEGDIIEEPLFN